MRPWLPLLLLLIPAAAQAAPGFAVKSPAFPEGGKLAKAQVNAKLACGNGGDVSPALEWSDPPAGTKSFAVTLFDPDARGGKGFWHWALFDLPPETRSLAPDAGKAGSPPDEATEATNSFGTAGYGGACPPPGDPPHHYIFTVWAVGEDKLPFDAGSTAEEVFLWLGNNSRGQAEITARYGR